VVSSASVYPLSLVDTAPHACTNSVLNGHVDPRSLEFSELLAIGFDQAACPGLRDHRPNRTGTSGYSVGYP
jgi:hypothetical protein